METRANYVAVGFFTLLVILASFGFIYWVATLDGVAAQRTVNVRIEGVVSGLTPNSEVHFNGIRVGKVDRVIFDPEDPRVVNALASINEDTPIRVDTTATISSAGLTGIAVISLKGGTPSAQSLFEATEPGQLPQIDARPSAVADIIETVRDVSATAKTTLESISQFVEENRQPISNTVANAEAFSKALGDNAEGIDEFLKSASGIGTSLSSLGDKLDGTVQGLEQLVAAVEPEKVKNTLANVEAFSADLRKGGERIGGIADAADKIAVDLEAFSGKLNTSLDKLDSVLGAVDSEDVKIAIADIKETAAGARKVVTDVRGVSKTFADRQEDIDRIVTNAREMTDRLNASSKRVDGVLAKLDGFLGDEGSQSVMAEVSTTLEEFRKAATTLQSAINGVSGGLTRFSNRGLRDIEALIGDARRSVSRIDRIVSTIERNPQEFIFGGSDVKTNTGRPRR